MKIDNKSKDIFNFTVRIDRSDENKRTLPIDPKGFNGLRVRTQNENARVLIKTERSDSIP